MTGRMAASDRATLTRSSRVAAGSRSRGWGNSGSSIGPVTSRTSMTGTPSRNTDPHQKFASRTPPTTGPMAMPPTKQLIHTAIAAPRCRGSVNMLLIRASVDGISVAPEISSSARAPMSIAGLVEYAASTDATPNAAAPISSSFRRPMRSPSEPIVTRNPAIMKL